MIWSMHGERNETKVNSFWSISHLIVPLCLENHSSKADFDEDVELFKRALPHMHFAKEMFQVEDAGRGRASNAYRTTWVLGWKE